jgi:hypothetical protein
MPTKEFLQARKQGEIAQRYVKGMFESWGLKFAATPRGYHPGYDGIIEGKFYGQYIRNKIEIKYDRLASTTGNIYLDIQSLKKSQATILIICLNDPIDTVLMLSLQDALEYAVAHQNINGGEFMERSACINKDQFMRDLKPKVLTTKQGSDQR